MTAGWAPIRVEWRDGVGVADLCRTEGMTFEEPFFDETIERCLRRPFNLLFRREVPLGELPEPVVEPDGFVLHASRCGSTLVTRLLQTVTGALVLAEPGAVDEVLRRRLRGVEEVRLVEWLRRVVGALALARGEPPARFFVKLDAWSTLDLPLLRRAYPQVPWLFVYRDPLEILVSQSRRRGLHMIPGALAPELFGLARDAPRRVPPEEYMARVLGSLLGAAAGAIDDERGRLIHWREFPGAFGEVVAPHFRLAPPSDARVAAVAAANAKNPALPFADDAQEKREAATRELRMATDRWARPAYEELEAARAAAEVAA